MNEKCMKREIVSLIIILMLACVVLFGFFAIPVGVPLCSIIGIFYGIKYKDKIFLRWSCVFLGIGVLAIAYVLMNISSM